MAVKSLKRAQKKIEIKDLKLGALLDVTLAINSNVGKRELFDIYEETLRELNIEKLALFINEGDWDLELTWGIDKKKIQVDVEKDLIPVEEITEVNSKTSGPFQEFDIVVPVSHKTKPLAYLLIGDTINEAIQISPLIKHLPFIQTFTNIIAVAIENKNLAKEAIRQERTKKELELASEMQSMLLPTSLPQDENIEISAFYQSHQQVGGDYYDVIWLNKSEFAFCIADVSGKGVSAAILMSNFQANVRVLVKHFFSFKDLVEDLNKKVIGNANGEKFITAFIAKYNLVTRKLTYVNCGHNAPVLINEGEVLELKDGCPGLGMIDELPNVNIGQIELSYNSTLVCYTDGLVEVENNANEEYGTSNLSKVMQNNQDSTMANLNQEIISSLDKFKEDQSYIDDIALLSCKFH